MNVPKDAVVTPIPEATLAVSTLESFSVPEYDIYDQPHPGYRINRDEFGPGRTYKVRSDIAAELREREKVFNEYQLRLLKPGKDRRALATMAKQGMTFQDSFTGPAAS